MPAIVSPEVLDTAYRRGWRYAQVCDPPPYDDPADLRNHLECMISWRPELTPARITAEVEGYADGLAGRPDRTAIELGRWAPGELESQDEPWWQR